MTEEQEQELFFKFSIFEKQIQEFQEQIRAVEKGIIELDSINFGLDELVNSKDKEIFASVGKGIFIKGKITSKKLNVDIGNGNFVKKSIPETKELIEEQIKKLEQIKKELEDNLEEVGKELTAMMEEIQKKENPPNHKE